MLNRVIGITSVIMFVHLSFGVYLYPSEVLKAYEFLDTPNRALMMGLGVAGTASCSTLFLVEYKKKMTSITLDSCRQNSYYMYTYFMSSFMVFLWLFKGFRVNFFDNLHGGFLFFAFGVVVLAVLIKEFVYWTLLLVRNKWP